MGIKIKNIIIVLSTTLSFLLNYTVVLSQTDIIQDSKLMGDVVRNDNNRLSIQTENEIVEYSIPQNIRITRNGIPVSLSAIQANDQVTLAVDGNNQVLSVSALSENLAFISKYLLPILGGLLILTGLILIANKNRNRGLIKTTPTNITSFLWALLFSLVLSIVFSFLSRLA